MNKPNIIIVKRYYFIIIEIFVWVLYVICESYVRGDEDSG